LYVVFIKYNLIGGYGITIGIDLYFVGKHITLGFERIIATDLICYKVIGKGWFYVNVVSALGQILIVGVTSIH
jgi:hypothetical protein